jgi:phenylalanyl-tRNA synthetase beta chain
MAVIEMDYRDLIYLLGKDIPMDELLTRIPMMGSDIDSVDGDELNVEFFPNRPDLYSVEGVARALKGFFGYEKGLAQYNVQESDLVLNVDPSVESVRPYIVSGYVGGVQMDDALIKSLMEIQEKLHLTLGRKRKKIAIGVHDFENLKPPFVYKAVDPESVRFIPLGHYKEMNLNEILQQHDKGIEYAWTLEGLDKYPIIVDSEDQVLSFPPIINGTITTVREETTEIFLDMTGLDFNALNTALNIITTLLAERGGIIKSVEVKYPDNTYVLPDLQPKNRSISIEYANRMLGTNYSAEKIVELIEMMRYGAAVNGPNIEVQVPAYRNDILHPIDIVEDIAIAALETKGLTLSSETHQFDNLLRKPSQTYTKIINPINEDLTCTRVSIFPNLLEVLKANKHRDLPQSLFEIGDVILEHKNTRTLSAVSIHPKASFTEIKSLTQSLMRDLDVEFTISGCKEPYFIPGRCANIMVEGKPIGFFGELHPQVIENYELGNPVVALEFNLKKITNQ